MTNSLPNVSSTVAQRRRVFLTAVSRFLSDCLWYSTDPYCTQIELTHTSTLICRKIVGNFLCLVILKAQGTQERSIRTRRSHTKFERLKAWIRMKDQRDRERKESERGLTVRSTRTQVMPASRSFTNVSTSLDAGPSVTRAAQHTPSSSQCTVHSTLRGSKDTILDWLTVGMTRRPWAQDLCLDMARGSDCRSLSTETSSLKVWTLIM